jgi:hypothetical protein
VSYIKQATPVYEEIIYQEKYKNNWMPIEYTIPNENLKDFYIIMNQDEDVMTALKDLERECFFRVLSKADLANLIFLKLI